MGFVGGRVREPQARLNRFRRAVGNSCGTAGACAVVCKFMFAPHDVGYARRAYAGRHWIDDATCFNECVLGTLPE